MTIGEKIYNLRTENKLSQDDLAAELKVSRHTIGKWENDIVSPSADNLSKLCKFFNVNGDYFIGEQTEVAVTEPTKSPKVSVYKVLLITLLSLCAVAFIIADVFIGIMVFTPNGTKGNGPINDTVTSPYPTIVGENFISVPLFWIMVAVTVVFVAGVAFALYLYKKKKVNY